MTKLIIRMIVLLFCLPLNAQPSSQNEMPSTPTSIFNGMEDLSVVNVAVVNSINHDYCPIAFDKGILFTSDRKEIGSGKIADANFYFSPFDIEGNLSVPSLYQSDLNSELQEGMASISPDGKTIVFSRDVKAVKQANGFSDVRLYTATLEDGVWTNIKKMSINSKKHSSGHPSFSPDGKKLYFVSNRPGSIGGTDIYVSELKKGKWAKPKNLGRKVNSAKNEMFPFAADDGSLYFSSNKKSGMGLLDIYKVTSSGDNKWGRPTNLGAPFNSPENDFGFYKIKNQNEGYFSSNREGGLGGNDIYHWRPEIDKRVTETPKQSNDGKDSNCVMLFGQLTKANGVALESEDVRVLVAELDGENEQEIYTDEKGAFKICLKCARSFSIKVFPIGYYMNDMVVSTEKYDCNNSNKMDLKIKMVEIESEEKIVQNPNMNNLEPEFSKEDLEKRNEKNKTFLESISIAENEQEEDISTADEINEKSESNVEEAGEATKAIEIKTIDLPKIYYGFDKFKLDDLSKEQLRDLSEFLKEHPDLKLSIKSYTDPKGKKAYNKWLSKRRAQEVMEYFVKTGIEQARLKTEGKGELTNVDNNDQEIDYSKNRRTEFEIISTEISVAANSETGSNITKSTASGELYVSNVYYEFDSYNLNDLSKSEVENVILRLLDNPELKVEIQSHTDARGSKTYNKWLSQKRANEVVRYMVSKGITKDRLYGVGYGETKLINQCEDGIRCTKAEHMKNRRTEFIFE